MDPPSFAPWDALTPEAPSHRLEPAMVAAVLGDVPRAIAALAESVRRRHEAPTRADTDSVPQATDDGNDANRSGDFYVSGLTLGAGHFVVSSVTFPRRADAAPHWGEITLRVDEHQNLPAGGLVVMRDGGFAPSREGFSLVMASAHAGVVRVHGRWSVTPATIDAPGG